MKKFLLFIFIFTILIASTKAYLMSVERVSYPVIEIKERNSAIIEIKPVSAKQGSNSSISNCCITGENNLNRSDSELYPLRKSSCSCCG